jgi:hypothetical protein
MESRIDRESPHLKEDVGHVLCGRLFVTVDIDFSERVVSFDIFAVQGEFGPVAKVEKALAASEYLFSLGTVERFSR